MVRRNRKFLKPAVNIPEDEPIRVPVDETQQQPVLVPVPKIIQPAQPVSEGPDTWKRTRTRDVKTPVRFQDYVMTK